MRRLKRGRSGKSPRWAYPDAVQREYAAAMMRLVDTLADLVRDNLIAVLPMAVVERDLQTRVDGWVETIEAAITRIPLAMMRDIAGIERETIIIGQNIADFNQTQWREVMRKSVGVDIMRGEPWLMDEIKSFAAENAALIKSIPDQTISRVQGIVQRGVRAGQSAKSLEADIMREMETTRARARLIARDQTSKLNGQLTQRRQEAIGLKTYYWDTSNDERVRPSHDALEGKLCRWDDDSVYSDDGGKTWKPRLLIRAYIGHPGSDYQCRCAGRSDTDALLVELGL